MAAATFGLKNLNFWIALLLFVVILFIIKGTMGIKIEGMETKEGIDGTASSATVTGTKKNSDSAAALSS